MQCAGIAYLASLLRVAALYVGAAVKRIKFGAITLFSVFRLVLVYASAAHWLWGGDWLQESEFKDLAGGIVVCATAGMSALVLAIIMGKRRGFPEHPHPADNPGMVYVGAAMF